MAPTALRHGPYRFFFYSNERGESPHIHVTNGPGQVKVWLDDRQTLAPGSRIALADHEVSEIRSLIKEHHEHLLEAWHDFFGRTQF